MKDRIRIKTRFLEAEVWGSRAVTFSIVAALVAWLASIFGG